MATEVVLRACGGIGPYTWSSTGSVILSSTEGTQITVSSSAPNTYQGNEAAYLTGASIYTTYYDSGSCGSSSCGDGTISSIVSGTVYNCAGQVVGVGTAVSSLSILFNTCSTGSCTVTAMNSGFSFHCPSCPLFEPGSPIITVNVNYAYLVNPWTGTGTLGASLLLSPNALSPSTIDLRSQAMIDAGCNICLSDPSGSTVTVTDDAGISVTYTF